ncbi:MAG: M28 family peptidase [Rectinemataceae bacterium]
MYESEARSALDLTGSLIDSHGPRLVGSPSCLATADALHEEAARRADQAGVEDFTVHPGAFLGFIRLLVVLYLFAALCLPFAAWVSALATSLGMVVLVVGFILYIGLLDPFWPAVKGRNVMASLEPVGKARQTLIVSGHHDSARIFNFYVDRPELYARRIYGGIGSFAAIWLASLALALLGLPFAASLAVTVVFLAGFALIAPLWTFAAKEGTPGAGDNLVASAVALEVLGHFRARRDAGAGLDSTRLVFLSFDAEEAGLRGARAWARAHRAEVEATPTYCLNMDCLFSADAIQFLTTDINGSVRLSADFAELCRQSAADAGIASRTMPIAFLTGGTDAAELAKVGVETTTLIAMKWDNESRSRAYHTPGDTVAAIEPAVVEAAIGIAIGVALRLDR